MSWEHMAVVAVVSAGVGCGIADSESFDDKVDNMARNAAHLGYSAAEAGLTREDLDRMLDSGEIPELPKR